MNNAHHCLRMMSAMMLIAASDLIAGGVKITPGNMSPYSKTHVSAKLYTEPDPSASGGIKGLIADAPSDVLGVIAVPQRFETVAALGNLEGGADAKNARNANKEMSVPAYLAVLGTDNSFSFTGLPAGKYDLLVVCDNAMYDGILLSRDPDTLTEEDVKSIKAKLKESNPFFNVKNAQRMAGQVGTFGRARVLAQDLRTLPITLQSAVVMDNIQIRAIKLCMMARVSTGKLGAMWELKRTRELVRQEVGPPDTKGLIPNYFCQKLQGIRVSTSIKDLGTIPLKPDDPKKAKTLSTEIE